MRRLWILLLIGCCLPLAADDEQPPLRFSLRDARHSLIVAGTSRLPHGTRLAATIRLGGKPLGWRKTYLLKGRFTFRLPRAKLPPGAYDVLVRYQRRGQLPELAKALAPFPPVAEVTRPWRLGTPLQAVSARLEELALLAGVAGGLPAHLEALGKLGASNEQAIKDGKYNPVEAQKAYDQWLARLELLGKPAREYARLSYYPEALAQLVNLLAKSDERARGAIRAELERTRVKVPRKYWPVNKLVRDARMLDPYLKRAVPAYVEHVKKLTKAATQEKEKLEEAGKED